MVTDPFMRLGLGSDATAEEVADARRRLARQHHPDRGGDAEQMRAVNAAADAALAAIARRRDESSRAGNRPATGAAARRNSARGTADRGATDAGPADRDVADPGMADDGTVEPGRIARDVPSFTVEALPAETFEALLIATAMLGDLLDADPPYRLDAYLRAPYDCWCRLDVVPDAGASTLSLTVAGIDGDPAPSLTTVRDAWVTALNSLDWPA